MKRTLAHLGLASAAFVVLFATGCGKKAAVVTPPPPPPPVQPKASAPEKPVIARFVAEPSTVVKGSPSTLRWSVSGASDISIDQGIGSVSESGTRQVFPSADTTYTLIARGVGGTSSSTVSIRVTDPAPSAPPPPPTPTARRSASEFMSQEVQDAYFAYDSFSIDDAARGTLNTNASAIKRFFGDDNYASSSIIIEGHCDERGSDAYNVALGDKRAQAALEVLKGLGVAESRLKTVSFGKERPQCSDANEACYQKNRRVHFAAQ